MITFGFRIVGSCADERRLVDWQAAFTGYADLDERADVNSEAYLSAFTFDDDFVQHLDATGSTKGFDGPCWSPWLWFDIDRADDLKAARFDAVRLCLSLIERYRIDDDDMLLFYSGAKGFHVGLPTALWQPDPSPAFHRVARKLAEGLAATAGVVIDAGVYDKVRAFRAPNSRHPKTGRHKLRLSFDELTGLSVAALLERAAMPQAFDLRDAPPRNDIAVADWQTAMQAVEREAAAKAERRAANNGTPTLNRQTLDFIRDGAGVGDRHRLLFSAAANLAEFGCPPALAHALLTESGRDSGLPPRDVHRQIECGLQNTSTPKPPAGDGKLFADPQGGGYYDAGF